MQLFEQPSLSSWMPEGLVLTAVATADLESLVDIRIEAMRESLERIGRFDPRRARERFVSGFSPAHTRNIEVDGERAGFVVAKVHADSVHLEHLYIRPRHQGRNIGGAVLARVIAEANGESLPIRVTALRGSDSNRFYLRYGFELIEAGEFDNYYVRPNDSRCDGAADDVREKYLAVALVRSTAQL